MLGKIAFARMQNFVAITKAIPEKSHKNYVFLFANIESTPNTSCKTGFMYIYRWKHINSPQSF